MAVVAAQRTAGFRAAPGWSTVGPGDVDEVDAITIALARQGDRRAIETIVRRNQDAVFAAIGRIMVARAADVEDAAQETFVKVVRGLGRFDPRGSAKLSTWILTIATRTAIDALRRSRVRPGLLGDELDGEQRAAGDPETALSGRELGRRVEAAMAALPADQRAVLVLRAFHDFDYPEIAEALGIELGTVKSRLARARVALREVIGADAEVAR